MPILKNRPPKYQRSGKYAVVYHHGKRIYLGDYGSPESQAAYSRFVAESQANHVFIPTKGEPSSTVRELAAGYLDHARATQSDVDYKNCCTVVFDFLLELYGDDTPVDSFKPVHLKLVREAMVQSRRFCRNTINKYTKRIIAVFGWGVENDTVPETTWRALKMVKALPKGYPGTFDHPEREAVPTDVVEATLPFLPPVVAAIVQIQWLTGMRPSEVLNMRVGDIDRSRNNGLWYYSPKHKTEKHIGKKPIPFGLPEQRLIEPYIIDKAPEAAVFSPRTAMRERAAEARADRKSKLTPSQRERDAKRAEKNESKVGEFYDPSGYRRAVRYAIEKGNRHGVQIPHWHPYLLRNAAETAIELEHGLDEAQAQLGHTSANMTKRYSSAQLRQREKLARNRRNPFATAGENDTPPDTIPYCPAQRDGRAAS